MTVRAAHPAIQIAVAVTLVLLVREGAHAAVGTERLVTKER